ncbi:MAG TPA: LPS biosynthesis protein WbpP, partial [Tissierellales bacterium]|nr:LPS biosynthesis protein WbpP [Tissierellales bacterium]
TINEIYDLMCEELDVDLKPRYVEPRAGDIKHSLADISKARKLLSYDPDWNFRDGFKEAINWYKENI